MVCAASFGRPVEPDVVNATASASGSDGAGSGPSSRRGVQAPAPTSQVSGSGVGPPGPVTTATSGTTPERSTAARQAVEQVEPVEALGQGDEPRPGALEHVGGLLEAVAGVDADDVRLARRDGGLPDQRVAPVRHPHRDGVAAPDPVLAQLLGERAGPPPELAAAHGVGHAVGRRVEHGGDLGVATGEPAEEVRKVGGHLAGGGERGHGVRHGGGRHGHSLGAGPRRVPGDHGHLVHLAGASGRR